MNMVKKDKVPRYLAGVESQQFTQGADIVQKSTQQISQAFLDDLKDQRNESTKGPAGDFMRVASIPTGVIEQWSREGFNIYEETGTAIVKRLHDQNLDAFLTTDKRI